MVKQRNLAASCSGRDVPKFLLFDQAAIMPSAGTHFQ
jgi:hypothetical protein